MQVPEPAKTLDVLLALYTPSAGPPPDAKARFILRTIEDYASQLHWARMQVGR